MHMLQQFVVGTMLPAVDEVMLDLKLGDQDEVRMRALLVIESFLWLHLGVELGAFPRMTSEDVYLFYYPGFFRWLERYNEIGHRGSPRPPFLESGPYLGLPDFVRELVGKGMEGGQPLYDQPSGVGQRPLLAAPFQSLLILYSRLCRDAAVRRFVYALNFQNSDDWEKDWTQECTAEALFNAVESSQGQPPAMILAGYMKLCEYGRNANEVLSSIEDLGILDRARLFQFKDRIHNIHAWRLNLSSGDAARRFEKVRARVNEMIMRELTALGLKDGITLVQQSLKNSVNFFFDFVRVPA